MLDARVDCFLNKNNIINDLPPFDKTTLFVWDDGGKHLFDPIGDDFGDDFISNIA